MPVYEYRCRACDHEFEQLVLPGRAEPTCPECQSGDLERKLSSFAVSCDGTRTRNVQVARRKAAASRDRVDKQVAERDYVRNHFADEGVKTPHLDPKKK